MKIKSLLTIVSIVAVCALSAQTKNYVREANDLWDNQHYFPAAEKFELASAKVVIKGPKSDRARILKGELTFRAGECYRYTLRVGEAEEQYQKAVTLRYYEEEPLVYFNLAEVQLTQGKIKEAKTNFGKYQNLVPSDERTKNRLESVKYAESAKKKPSKHEINNLKRLNTDAFDMCPVVPDKKGKTLMFASTRDASEGDGEDPRSGGSYFSLWITEFDKNGIPKQPEIVEVGKISTLNNEASVCFDGKFKTMYFTRCYNMIDQKDFKGQNVGCDIMVSQSEKKAWGDPEVLKIKDADSISVGHPCVNDANNFLIFSSDMAGGFGGRDLWYVTFSKKEKVWSMPKNMGEHINTPGDEMFPTFLKSGDLAFASNGHIGMGGLDMFIAPTDGENKWAEPVNMGFPRNSTADDYHYIEYGDDNGFFTSNRRGSKGYQDDLWSYKLPPVLVSLKIIVRDQETDEIIPGATIKLLGTDNLSIEQLTTEDGTFTFDKKENNEQILALGHNYTFEISKEKYLGNKGQISTKNVEDSKEFVVDVYLINTDKPIKMPEVRYDFGKAELQVNDSVNSQDSLNYLYDIMIENPTIVVELMAHTDCRGSDANNLKLSQRRAQSCVDYLIDKGIPKERLKAKGYGETTPLEYKTSEDAAGVKLTCNYIKALPTKDEQEMLHQRNRRTEFQILSWDFVPKDEK
jgi:outer membrane protein OmpA-like peptidoglycan-associated protein